MDRPDDPPKLRGLCATALGLQAIAPDDLPPGLWRVVSPGGVTFIEGPGILPLPTYITYARTPPPAAPDEGQATPEQPPL